MYRGLRKLVIGSVVVLSSGASLAASQRAQHFNYDEDLAKLSTIYSSAAYDRNPAVGNWSFVNPACNERTEGFILNETYTGEGTEAFGYVGLDDAEKMIVVAFKGTSDLRDWMTDLRSWVRYTKRCAPVVTKSTRTSEELIRSEEGTDSDLGSDFDSETETDSVTQADLVIGLHADVHAAKVDANSVASSVTETQLGSILDSDLDSDWVSGFDFGSVVDSDSGSDASMDAHTPPPDDILGGKGAGVTVKAGGRKGKAAHLGVGRRERNGAGVRQREQLELEWREVEEGGGGVEAGGGGGGRRGVEEAQRRDSEPGRAKRGKDSERSPGKDSEQDSGQDSEQGPGQDSEQGPGKDSEQDPGQDELIGNVHFGFCEYYQSVVAEGLADRVALLARENPTYTVLVTGHSLGAAAAAVCAADLAQRMLVESERVVLYTLGEPRAGDGIFAEGLNDRVGTAYRVVHNRDIVPHLALCCHGWFGKCKAGEVSCPYQHTTEIVYANDMGPGASWLMCNGTIGEDYACDPQAVDLSVSDHTHYFELLVGEYCATAPEDLVPVPESVAREEARWALYEAAMRRENNPNRFERWPGDENPSSSLLKALARS